MGSLCDPAQQPWHAIMRTLGRSICTWCGWPSSGELVEHQGLWEITAAGRQYLAER